MKILNIRHLVHFFTILITFGCVSCSPHQVPSEYTIVELRQPEGHDFNLKEKFEAECNKLIESGWAPSGGVSAVPGERGGVKRIEGFYQAFTR